MGHVHVRDKQTGHEYVVPERLFKPEAHERTGKPARDAHGDLASVKFRKPLGAPTPAQKQAAKKASDKTAADPAAESGQQAEPEKE